MTQTPTTTTAAHATLSAVIASIEMNTRFATALGKISDGIFEEMLQETPNPRASSTIRILKTAALQELREITAADVLSVLSNLEKQAARAANPQDNGRPLTSEEIKDLRDEIVGRVREHLHRLTLVGTNLKRALMHFEARNHDSIMLHLRIEDIARMAANPE